MKTPSDKARWARRAALGRARPAKPPFSKRQSNVYWISFCVWIAFVVGLRMLTVRGLDQNWRPASPDAALWWLEPSAYVQILTVVGVLAAPVLAFVAARLKSFSGWILAPVALFAGCWAGAGAFASTHATLVFPDRIESRAPWSGRAMIVPMTQVVSVDVACSSIRVSRQKTIPSIDYVLWLRDGRWVDLSLGLKDPSLQGVREWLSILDGIDRNLTAQGVARLVSKDSDGVNRVRPACIRDLSNILSATEFVNARRILAIGDEDLYAYGLDPRGVW